MKTLTRFLFSILLLECVAFGATTNERVTLTLTVTNVPVTGDAWTFQSTTRTWTNLSSSSYILTNLSGVGPATTNLANNIAEFAYANGPWNFRWSATNQIQIVGPVGTAIAVSFTGTWAEASYSTQKVALTRTMLFPLDALIDSNRIDQASEMVRGIGLYTTNAIPTNSVANRNYLRKTNDIASGITIISPTFTNAVNYGNPFVSQGPGAYSLQFGIASSAIGEAAIAIGSGAYATNQNAVGIGSETYAEGVNSVAIGSGTYAQALGTIALGVSADADANYSIALGYQATAHHTNAIAIGYGVNTTRTNEIRLGGSQDVVIGGLLSVEGALSNNAPVLANGTWTNAAIAASAATITNLQALGGYDTNRAYDKGFATNLTLSGANTLKAGSSLAIAHTASTAIADGANVFEAGSNAYVRFTANPTAAWQLAGILGDLRDGRVLTLENSTGYEMLVLNESGLAATAGSRISCGTSFSLQNGGIMVLTYDTTASRWKVISSRNNLGANGLVFVSVGTNYNGTNWAPLTTNISAGVFPLGAFAQLASARSNYLVLPGATSTYTNIFASADAERVTTNSIAGVLSGTLTTVYSGYYLVSVNITILGEVDNNGDTVELEVFLDGVAQEHTETSATLATGVKTGISTSCLLYIPAGTAVTARIKNESDATCSLPVLQTRLNIDSP